MSLGELVPGACQLAVVATEDAIADQWTQGFIDAAVVFDGEVADAAPGIDTIRCDDGAGWTDVDAARAGAAMRAGRRVHWQRQVGKDLTEEKPGAVAAVDQATVFADPAEPGITCQGAFQQIGRAHV